MLCAHPGEFVERQLCRDAILPMPLLCEVPCPKDCALSPWTSWSHCSHTCSGKNTEGKQTRARSILAYNAGEGKSTDILVTQPEEASIKLSSTACSRCVRCVTCVPLCSDSQGGGVGHCDAG